MMGRNGDGRVLVEKVQNNEDACDGPPTSQFHVVAVDDSIVDCKFIERLLRSSAYKVTTVDSGRRALEFNGFDAEENAVNIENKKVNMITTDCCVAGMTAYDLLKSSSSFQDLLVLPFSLHCIEENNGLLNSSHDVL